MLDVIVIVIGTGVGAAAGVAGGFFYYKDRLQQKPQNIERPVPAISCNHAWHIYGKVPEGVEFWCIKCHGREVRPA